MDDNWIKVGNSYYNVTILKGLSKTEFKKQFRHLPKWEDAFKEINNSKKSPKKSKPKD